MPPKFCCLGPRVLQAVSRALPHLVVLLTLSAAVARQGAPGPTVRYQLPTEGTLPRTYRVTLAITDPNDPARIVSTFIAGAPRTVTAENGGIFTETWNGLDENFMPVSPGRYGVKGIYMPASPWPVDRQFHSVTVKYLGAADSWGNPLGSDQTPLPIAGDPVGYPLADISASDSGTAALYFEYLENAKNQFLVDLRRPIGPGQIIASFPSWGAAGGTAVTTDGKTIWSYGGNIFNGPKFIYRADGKPFGTGSGKYRKNVYRPEGWPTGLANCYADPGLTTVFVAERGKVIQNGSGDAESADQFVNQVLVLNGTTAQELAKLQASRPRSVFVSGKRLYVLEENAPSFVVTSTILEKGLPKGPLQKLLAVPPGINPAALAVDRTGSIYLADSEANKIYKMAVDGHILMTIGRLATQEPGAYDRLSFIAPEKLALWYGTDDRPKLLVLEAGGPNRLTEWDDQGQLLREWLPPQTKSNGGYTEDPHDTSRIYIRGQRGWLDRFRVDASTGIWAVDAVWPHVGENVRRKNPIDFSFYPHIVYTAGNEYLASAYNYMIYRFAGKRWIPSAGLVGEAAGNKTNWFVWRDVNGDGIIQPEEYKGSPTTPPPGTLRYFGENWSDDLSLLAIGQGTTDVWRLAPKGFDRFGNPIFDPTTWTKIITDPILAARKSGNPTNDEEKNELANSFNSSWAMVTGNTTTGFYVNARGGKDFSANYGAQQKISYYAPGPNGQFTLKWRVGRTALNVPAKPGEIYGSTFIDGPINGILGITDQTRSGYLLYTDDGLYVDTLLADQRAGLGAQAGAYAQPEEYFAGKDYLDSATGVIRLAWGKTQPILYSVQGWSSRESPVHRLSFANRSVDLRADETAEAPQFARALRGDAHLVSPSEMRIHLVSATKPAVDSSMRGWEGSVATLVHGGAEQFAEVRCLYDNDDLYIRWRVKLNYAFEARDLDPPERIFVHDRQATVASLYLGSSVSQSGPKRLEGRQGDVRIVFGIFKSGGHSQPVALGMFPKWANQHAGSQVAYRSPAGAVSFENVALLKLRQMVGIVDPDRRGFLIVAVIPRSELPLMPAFTRDLRLPINFSANFGGKNKSWWANADGLASRETSDEPTEAMLYPDSWGTAVFVP